MTVSLIVRRRIRATPARLFDAWLDPAQVIRWWGPKGVRCTHAEIDPKVGGKLRIANLLPDGRTLWILGELLEIVPPERVVYTWRTDPDLSGEDERVTVRFVAIETTETEVIVTHERIASEETKAGHDTGWQGCLDGLAALLDQP